ncbi:DUF2637 domain-containing protein [Streptomyces sp. NPDC002004]
MYEPHGRYNDAGAQHEPHASEGWPQPDHPYAHPNYLYAHPDCEHPHHEYDCPHTPVAQQPLTSFAPDAAWDPAEELAELLADQASADQNAFPPPADPAEADGGAAAGDPLSDLSQITSELPVMRPVPGHRRVRQRRPAPYPLQRVSFFLAAVAAVIVAMVSVFGGMATYDPLRHIADLHTTWGAACWPLLVYGPWMVASLCVLRAALHRRHAVHSWAVVLLFSGVAMLLCVAQAPRTFTGIAAAALPAVASLACFHQIVRQITLTRPPRRTVHRRRQAAPRPTATARPKGNVRR